HKERRSAVLHSFPSCPADYTPQSRLVGRGAAADYCLERRGTRWLALTGTSLPDSPWSTFWSFQECSLKIDGYAPQGSYGTRRPLRSPRRWFHVAVFCRSRPCV